MVSVQNNFEGGPDGAALTVSNSNQSGSQNGFDYVAAGSLKLLFANAGRVGLGRPTAEYVLELTNGSPGDYQYCYWNSIGDQTQIWTRFYVFFSTTALTTDTDDLNLFTVSTAGNSDLVAVYLRNTVNPVVLQIYNCSTGGLVNMTTAIVANTWNRVEFQTTLGSGSTSSASLSLYAGDNVDTYTATEQISQSSQNYGGTSGGIFTIGNFHNWQRLAPVTYFSNWTVNNIGYPGPAPFRQGLGVPMNNQPNPIALHMV